MSMATSLRAKPAAEETVQRLNLLLLVASLLLTIGLIMMTSASVDSAGSELDDPFHYFKRQIIFTGIGLFSLLVVLHIPMSWWNRSSSLLLVISFVLLALVLVPGVGLRVGGSMRWINLGWFNLQPSELAKVFFVLFMAAYLERHHVAVQERWLKFLIPLVMIGLAGGLLALEPDHGTLIILMLTALCMMFLAGASPLRFFLMLVLGSGAVVYLAMKRPYVIKRFQSFLDPFAAENVYDGGYQLTQALIAFGRGGWFGTGLGGSIQKLYFLPGAHTDFVLAIIGEELGLLGVSLVIILFCLVVGKGISIARDAQREGNLFNCFVAYGISLLFAGNALINIGVNIGLLPTKGLTLPFLSYGGASLIVCCFQLALLLRIEYETQARSRQTEKATRRWHREA